MWQYLSWSECVVSSQSLQYISNMNSTLKKLLYITLFASYSFGATAGNIIVLRELLSSGAGQHHITSETKSRPIPDSPVCIVKFHIVPLMDTEHSFHVAPSNDVPLLLEPQEIIVNVEIALIYSSLEFLPSKPRDPPLT